MERASAAVGGLHSCLIMNLVAAIACSAVSLAKLFLIEIDGAGGARP